MPPRHSSRLVQGSRSSQGVMSGSGSNTQAPVASSHPPTVQGVSSPEQSMGTPRHSPKRQASWSVQREPSSHSVPAGSGVATQSPVPGSQVPSWQPSASGEQSFGAPAQTPPPQHPGRVVQLAFDALGGSLLSVADDGSVALWNANTGAREGPVFYHGAGQRTRHDRGNQPST